MENKFTNEMYYQSLVEALADAIMHHEYEDAEKLATALDKFQNKMLNSDEYISSGKVTELGISRQRLQYWVKQGYVKTIPHGKQKRYSLKDVNKMMK